MKPERATSIIAKIATLSSPFAALMGCQRAPSFSIVGSYFPDWIFCCLAGIAVALLARWLFVRLRVEREIQPPILIYPCIALSCSVTSWLLLFS
jgi:YtcA-like protein